MKKRDVIGIIVILIFGIMFGWFIKEMTTKPETKIIEKVDTIIEHNKIDSLITVIKEKDVEIENLKTNVKIIKEIQYVKSEKIKSLPIDSGVSLLRQNLLTYGTLTKESDTLPSLVQVNKDTLVEIGNKNLKDINVAFSDLGFERKISKTYAEIIEADNVIRLAQDTIIQNKSLIIDKQNVSISSLESALKSEKKKKKRNTFILGAAAVILGALNLVH